MTATLAGAKVLGETEMEDLIAECRTRMAERLRINPDRITITVRA